MQNLVPRAAYSVDDTGFWDGWPRYLFVVYAIGFGITWFVINVDWTLRGDAWRSSALVAAAFAIWGGALNGFLVSTLTVRGRRKRQERLADALYDGDPGLVPEPPDRDGYAWRLPCSAIVSPRITLAGVLYVGKAGLRFQARAGKQRGRRQRTTRIMKPPAVDMGPVREITLQVLSLPRTWLGRRITRRAPKVVIIRWPHHAIGLRVPLADETVPRLQACLDALRYDSTAAMARRSSSSTVSLSSAMMGAENPTSASLS
jgi:hypothetical protein